MTHEIIVYRGPDGLRHSLRGLVRYRNFTIYVDGKEYKRLSEDMQSCNYHSGDSFNVLVTAEVAFIKDLIGGTLIRARSKKRIND